MNLFSDVNGDFQKGLLLSREITRSGVRQENRRGPEFPEVRGRPANRDDSRPSAEGRHWNCRAPAAERAAVIHVPKPSGIKFSDPKDIPLLALVQASKAHYFVTGDKKLLELKKHGSTLFLTPREAMEILQNK